MTTRLQDVVRDLDELDEKATIYVPRSEVVISGSTPVMLVPSGAEVPEGWTYMLELSIAREVLEVWSSWRDDRAPTLEEACEAIIYYADYDAYLGDDDEGLVNKSDGAIR